MSPFDFFTSQHDFPLVLLAASVCLISSYACIGLLRHAKQRRAPMLNAWTAVAALSVGFGIWSTHFIAMLAYRPGFTLHYDAATTAASLAIAVLICAVGIAFATKTTTKSDQFLGGAMIGLAISCMHYTGIASLVMGGMLQWNLGLVLFSVAAGSVLGGASFISAGRDGKSGTVFAVLLLTSAICLMHFSGMAAADFSGCFPLSPNSEDTVWLAVALGLAALLVIGAALTSMFLDKADKVRTALENARRSKDASIIAATKNYLETSLNSMAQGLCFHDELGKLQLYNPRFLTLLGLEQAGDLHGKTFVEVTKLALRSAGYDHAQIEQWKTMAIDKLLGLIETGGEIVTEFGADRVLKISHSPAGNGSWVTTVHDVTERARTEKAMSIMARHDHLTGLPNRGEFANTFDVLCHEAEAPGEKIAVIAFDLDHFKEVNDTFGHGIGDELLKSLAKSLLGLLREGEVVARLGGDEFAALKRFTRHSCLRLFVDRLQAAINTRIEVGDIQIQISGSIGIAVRPDDGIDCSKLLSNADMAMYRAKADPEQRPCYYLPSMHDEARRRRAMIADLAEALKLRSFQLVYQVQKSVKSKAITGYEALLRWDRPGEGPVSPAEFIPVAEASGTIHGIGEWVLHEACREAAGWPEPFKIAVNVSALQVTQVEFIATVRRVLKTTGLPPKRLELEVTETAIISDKVVALYVLRQIKALGVSIAIDDFGTGYSSLDTLRSFPFDKIKLDRSFLQQVETDEQSRAILHAIVALGRSLSIPILAEGVETEQQMQILRDEGCSEAQGYLLGRPVRLDAQGRPSDLHPFLKQIG